MVSASYGHFNFFVVPRVSASTLLPFLPFKTFVYFAFAKETSERLFLLPFPV